MSKKYRFFYHYYRQYNEMSVHFKGKCYRTKNVICNSSTETKWNKRQPYIHTPGYYKNGKFVCNLKWIQDDK